MKFNRRSFIRQALATVACGSVFSENVWAEFIAHPLAGRKLPRWEKGHLRITTFYCGNTESTFLLFPDGTSLLIDLGEYLCHDKIGPGLILPSKNVSAGELVSRYILEENPFGRKVDYFLLTHYHSDHFGALGKDARKTPYPRSKNGRYTLRGFGAALDRLDFSVIIDRSWPDVNDPVPRSDNYDGYTVAHLKEVYAEATRRGTRIERFELKKGSRQIRLVHDDSLAKSEFAVRPLCARGQMLKRDGTVVDMASAVKGASRSKFDENMLSIGLTVSLGDFGYFNAGDFSNVIRGEGNASMPIESVLAPELDRVEVMKASHHAFRDAMPQSICSALSPRVLVCGVWHREHMHKEVLPRLLNGDRPCLFAPGIFPASRQVKEENTPWVKAMAPEAFKGCHSVVDVAPDGKTYRLMLVSAADYEKTVLGAYEFRTRNR